MKLLHKGCMATEIKFTPTFMYAASTMTFINGLEIAYDTDIWTDHYSEYDQHLLKQYSTRLRGFDNDVKKYGRVPGRLRCNAICNTSQINSVNIL